MIDARAVLGLGWFIGDTQAHYPLANPLVEGGQLYAFFLPEAVGSCATDLNVDGTTNGADLGVLLGGWGQAGLTDLNRDGTTDGVDVGLLFAAWGIAPSDGGRSPADPGQSCQARTSGGPAGFARRAPAGRRLHVRAPRPAAAHTLKRKCTTSPSRMT